LAEGTRGKKGGCGTGFVAALPDEDAAAVVEASEDAEIIGRVDEGEEAVSVRGLELRD
jgi:phosphoribosylformylglycinamidine cyclo-ligase